MFIPIRLAIVLVILQTAIACNTAAVHSTVFTGETGLIRQKDGLKLLLANGLTDTTGGRMDLTNEQDTIGRYFKMDDSPDYICCIMDRFRKDAFEANWLLEISPAGRIVKKARFLHFNYPCCWKNAYEGFKRFGNYYGFIQCNTGSGYCASYVYLFKEITSQEEQARILLAYNFEGFESTEHLTSSIDIKNDTVTVSYQLRNEIPEALTDEIVEEKTRFEVQYRLAGKKWYAIDSSQMNWNPIADL
ncbi:hypothetical protein [Chitinophaga arvensicola]|uniref:Uncharacterized protein n=1 Tax=Chitinophaga arvensicola TaxID=29529 RepID=A0A1I0QIV1_9BACT|nr:hypothetical protein [Chitinophaga arvensicola]SEW26938.1 hypothetical protein SAMN04488122_1499 [Chitinophaga arvensicola]